MRELEVGMRGEGERERRDLEEALRAWGAWGAWSELGGWELRGQARRGEG